MNKEVKHIFSLENLSKASEKITLYALFSNAALFSMVAPFSYIMGISVVVFIVADILLLIRFLQKKKE